jgi:hypothetical protein
MPPRTAIGALAAALLSAVITLLVAALGLVAAELLLGEAAVVARVATAFEDGGARAGFFSPSLPWDDEFRDNDARVRVPRHALAADLAALLRPAATAQYALVVGESGTGKSTAVRDVIRALPTPKGAIYFTAPELVESFSSELARAVGCVPRFNSLASVLSRRRGQVPQGAAAWPELRRALKAAAASFRARYARPAVLVIDAADLVAKKDPAFFRDLQDFAKGCADAGSLRVVFVSSEGAALPLMRASSAWSRALPPYEVPDIDDALAIDYLVERGMSRAAAEEAVHTVTGGRFSLLLHVASAAAARPVAAVRHELDIATDSALQDLGLAPTHALFRALVTVGRVAANAARAHAPASVLDALLRANIVALHADGTFTAHSRHVEGFLRRGLAAAEGE